MNSILTKVYIIFVRKYLYEFLKIAWQVLCGFFRRCLVVSMSFSTAKSLSEIPCNGFAFTEKCLWGSAASHMGSALSHVGSIASHVGSALSQKRHNRQLNITATEKMRYISMWLFLAVRFSIRKCAV